jgi:hypothetical protein
MRVFVLTSFGGQFIDDSWEQKESLLLTQLWSLGLIKNLSMMVSC